MNNLLIICGSGISMLAPACIPGVKEIMIAARHLLMPDETALERALSARALRDVQPELFFEDVLWLFGDKYLGIWDLIAADLRKNGDPQRPNLYHYLIVWVAAKMQTPVITLNFDTMLEKAADALGIKVSTYIPGCSATRDTLNLERTGSTFVLWKIHGSIGVRDDRDRPSLVNTMTRLAQPNGDLLEALTKWLVGRTVCIVGYSGRDADFFPNFVELTRKSSSRAVWIDPSFPKGNKQLSFRCQILGGSEIGTDLADYVKSQGLSTFEELLGTGDKVQEAQRDWEAYKRKSTVPVEPALLKPDQETLLIERLLRLGLQRTTNIGASRALLVASLLHSGHTRHGYRYAHENRTCIATSLHSEPDVATKFYLDLARLCDWNSRYAEYREIASLACRQAKTVSRKTTTDRQRRAMLRIGSLTIQMRAKQMSVGPVMSWPNPDFDFEMPVLAKGHWFLSQLLTTLRIRLLFCTALPRYSQNIFLLFPRDATPDCTFDEAMAWQYYADHVQVFGNLVLRGVRAVVGKTRGSAIARWFVAMISGLSRSYGSAYTQADMYLWRYRHGLESDLTFAQHLWTLVGHPVGLAMTLRDQGRERLEEWEKTGDDRQKTAAYEAFRQAYGLSLKCGSHLTALKALIGLYHVNPVTHGLLWKYHVCGIQGQTYKLFFKHKNASLVFCDQTPRECLKTLNYPH